ncbi:MAG: replicative helicase [Actinomycetota bacterium]|jgi:replicative DNA helicase
MVQSLEDARRQRTSGARVPPHDLAAETSLLGAMLLSPNAIGAAAEVHLTAGDFYKPAHGHIYEAIEALYHRGEPADPVTVSDELHRDGLLEAIGGAATLVEIQRGTPAISNAARYARIVEEMSQLRRLIGVAAEIADLGYSLPDDVATVLDRAETLVFDVKQRRLSDDMMPVSELLTDALDKLEALYDRGEAVTGVPTGFEELDHRLAGLQPNNLVVVGARPAVGKTSFALGILAHAAMEARVPSLLFSLEMGKDEITQRLLCSEARVDAGKLRTGNFDDRDWQKITAAVGRLAEAPIYIDDNPNVTVMDIRAKARRLKAREGLGLIIIDYMQLMTGRNKAENRQVEVAEMSRSLKILARELEIPVMALSQLSRTLEQRQDKRPMLSDLRESGSLEQDADVVMFLYRDELYHPDSADKGIAEVIVAKHRSGPTGTTQLAFLPQFTRFATMARTL